MSASQITVAGVLNVIDDITNVYIRDKLTGELVAWYDGRELIDTDTLNDIIESISVEDNKTIIIRVIRFETDFNDLDGEAKLNCLYNYVNKIFPYDEFGNLTIAEIEKCAYEFWRESEYIVDKYGDWYDEELNKV